MAFLRGQNSTEYLILLGVSLILMLVVLVFVEFWPGFTYSIGKQKSDAYWAGARPFAVLSHAVTPYGMALEVENTEPVSLTINRMEIGGVAVNFHNYSLPYSGAGTDACAGKGCRLLLPPGKRALVYTNAFNSTPPNPCLSGGNFVEGNEYNMSLAIRYYASDAGAPETERGEQDLLGSCVDAMKR